SAETAPQTSKGSASTPDRRPPAPAATSFELPHGACKRTEESPLQVVGKRNRLDAYAGGRADMARGMDDDGGFRRPHAATLNERGRDGTGGNGGRRNENDLARVGGERPVHRDRGHAAQRRDLEPLAEIASVAAKRGDLVHVVRKLGVDGDWTPVDRQSGTLNV